VTLPSTINFSLPEETPHPLAGSVDQVIHTPTSVWIHRRTDSHEVSVETGGMLRSYRYPKLIEQDQKRFELNHHAKSWHSPDGTIIVRLRPAPGAKARLTAHETRSGSPLWESELQIKPSICEVHTYHGPLNPELFLATNTANPVLCVSYAPEDEHGLVVHQFSKYDGAAQWSLEVHDAFVDIITKAQFEGIFRSRKIIGRIDYESGKVQQSDPLPGVPSQPIRIDGEIYFSTHTTSSATLWSTDDQCSRIDQVLRFDQKRVRETQVYAAANQPLLRVNQNALWFKNAHSENTQVKFKPWVYGVAASEGGPLFVMTDGNGGRMLAYSRSNGKELLNLKPTVGGYGTHAFLKNHKLIVASETTKKDWTRRALRIVSTSNCNHTLLPIDGYLLSAHFDHALIQARDPRDPNSFTLLDLREARSLL